MAKWRKPRIGQEILSFSSRWVALLLFATCINARAQHLWWELGSQPDPVCLYCEITVVATHPSVYYCGANWWPGSPAGGYCGIQDNSATERRTIFSVWDTTPELHPVITRADAKTVVSQFKNEGEGAHTHMLWNWKAGETFQFFVQKQAGQIADTTDTRYYVFDRSSATWRHSATITSPNGGKRSVATFGGGQIASFLENYLGKDRAEPKAALYRLWLGPTPDSLTCLTLAHGDGIWGRWGDSYFLAEGDPARLAALFAEKEALYGKPVVAEKGGNAGSITDRPVAKEVVAALKSLPVAPVVVTGVK